MMDKVLAESLSDLMGRPLTPALLNTLLSRVNAHLLIEDQLIERDPDEPTDLFA